jgi:putative Holliday junction resolvase
VQATQARNATVIAFDFGTRRVGVAIGNTLTRTARPLVTIDARDEDARWREIEALVAEWQPAQLVVGLPTHADGTPHQMTAQARRFASELDARFGLPVALVDERFTSELAKSELSAAGMGGRENRALRDQLAAHMILEVWLHEQHDA